MSKAQSQFRDCRESFSRKSYCGRSVKPLPLPPLPCLWGDSCMHTAVQLQYTPYSKMARTLKRAEKSNLMTRQQGPTLFPVILTVCWMIIMSQNCCLPQRTVWKSLTSRMVVKLVHYDAWPLMPPGGDSHKKRLGMLVRNFCFDP